MNRLLVCQSADSDKMYLAQKHSDEKITMFFEKGSFIIPFTGEDVIDAKINSIIYDYNESSEIEENKMTIEELVKDV